MYNVQVSSAREPVDRPVVSPRVDVFESDADLLVVADLPGVQESGVRLTLERGQLLLEATAEAYEGAAELIAAEFAAVDYRRAFLVPKGVDSERIGAELRNGVLTIRLPKSAQAQPRRIKVDAVQ